MIKILLGRIKKKNPFKKFVIFLHIFLQLLHNNELSVKRSLIFL
jgi:hypothetical protein